MTKIVGLLRITDRIVVRGTLAISVAALAAGAWDGPRRRRDQARLCKGGMGMGGQLALAQGLPALLLQRPLSRSS